MYICSGPLDMARGNYEIHVYILLATSVFRKCQDVNLRAGREVEFVFRRVIWFADG